MIERLKSLQANKEQFFNAEELFNACKSNSTLQIEIEQLSKEFLKKDVQGCSNCYMDAYLELISLNIKSQMEKIKCQFALLVGALLHDIKNYDNDLLCSNANITDDLALYHLKTNPKCRQFFQELPENVDELIEAYQLPGEEKELSEEEKEALELAIKAQADAENTVVDQIVEQLKAGTTKTAIKESFKETKIVGTKNLTQRFLIELVDRASAQIVEVPKA